MQRRFIFLLILTSLLNLSARADEKNALLFQGVTLSGLIELEAAHSEDYEGSSESDLTVATVELGLEAVLDDWIKGNLLFLYEEDDTDPPEVDEAIITIGNLEKSPFFAEIGQMYIWGRYETNLVSDPLTLEIGELRSTALKLGAEKNGMNGWLAVFSGNSRKGWLEKGNAGETIEHSENKKLDRIAAQLGYGQASDDFGYDVSFSYVNNLADSDTLNDAITYSKALQDYVGGYTAFVKLDMAGFTGIVEYLTANDAFAENELSFANHGAKPKAWNLELGYTFDVHGKEVVVATAYQGTKEALALELPKRRFLVGLGVGILDNLSLSFEYGKDKDYDEVEGGTGNSADFYTAKLALEF